MQPRQESVTRRNLPYLCIPIRSYRLPIRIEVSSFNQQFFASIQVLINRCLANHSGREQYHQLADDVCTNQLPVIDSRQPVHGLAGMPY